VRIGVFGGWSTGLRRPAWRAAGDAIVKLRSRNRYHNRGSFRTCGKKPCKNAGFGTILQSWEFFKIMKINAILAISLAIAVSACGPGQPAKAPESATEAAAAPVPAGPEYDSAGVIATVDGQVVTLDHEGASAAGLVAGRAAFQAHADTLAEAPLAPGTRVAVRFRKVGATYELTDLKGR